MINVTDNISMLIVNYPVKTLHSMVLLVIIYFYLFV